MSYQYIPSMPRYVDPDAMTAEVLIQASYLLQSIGRKQESEDLAEQARKLFDGVPYDSKKEARVLGGACCHPDGVLSCSVNAGRYLYEIASRPYSVDDSPIHAAKTDLKAVRAEIQACASDFDLGWLPADQLSAAVSGKAPRKHAHTLVKDVMLYQGLAASMQKAMGSGDPAAINHVRVSWMGSDARHARIGSSKAVNDSRRLANMERVKPDEGSDPDMDYRRGYWLLWVPGSHAKDAADRILKAGGDKEAIEEAVNAIRPMRRGVWIPCEARYDLFSTARDIAARSVDTAAQQAGLTYLDQYIVESAACDIETALRAAWHFRHAVTAYQVILDAAGSDPDSMSVLSGIGIVDDGLRPELDMDEMRAVAQASYLFGYQSRTRLDYLRSDSAEPEKVEAFITALQTAVEQNLFAWFDTDDAKSLTQPAQGSYLNCPVRADDENNTDTNTNTTQE